MNWLHRRDVHGGEVSAGVVSGLVAPTAPDNHRWETLWHYLQSGPGVFKGDLHFYKVDGDIRDKVDQIDGRTAPTSICSPANTTIPAPPRARSMSPSAPARRPRS